MTSLSGESRVTGGCRPSSTVNFSGLECITNYERKRERWRERERERERGREEGQKGERERERGRERGREGVSSQVEL